MSQDQDATRTSLQETGGVAPLPSDNAGQLSGPDSTQPAPLADASTSVFTPPQTAAASPTQLPGDSAAASWQAQAHLAQIFAQQYAQQQMHFSGYPSGNPGLTRFGYLPPAHSHGLPLGADSLNASFVTAEGAPSPGVTPSSGTQQMGPASSLQGTPPRGAFNIPSFGSSPYGQTGWVPQYAPQPYVPPGYAHIPRVEHATGRTDHFPPFSGASLPQTLTVSSIGENNAYERVSALAAPLALEDLDPHKSSSAIHKALAQAKNYVSSHPQSSQLLVMRVHSEVYRMMTSFLIDEPLRATHAWEMTTTGQNPSWVCADTSTNFEIPRMPNDSWVHFLGLLVRKSLAPLDQTLMKTFAEIKKNKLNGSNMNNENTRDTNLAAMRALDAALSTARTEYIGVDDFDVIAMDCLTGKPEALFGSMFQRGMLAALNEYSSKEHTRLARSGNFVPFTSLRSVRLEGGVIAFSRVILTWLNSDMESVRALSAIAGAWSTLSYSSSSTEAQRGRQEDAPARGRSASRTRGQSQSRGQSRSRGTKGGAAGDSKRFCEHCHVNRPRIEGTHNTADCRMKADGSGGGGQKSTPSGGVSGAPAAGGVASAAAQQRRK